MNESKSSISQATSYQEIGEFWDSHDLTDFWDQTEAVEFEVDIESETTWHALEATVAAEIAKFAKMQGVKSETLINVWLRERLNNEAQRVCM